MQVTLEYAQEHLSELLTFANSGQQIQIARPEGPTVKLVLVSSAEHPVADGPRMLGAGVGQMIVPSWDDWKAMDAELEREMIDAPLMTSGEL